MSGKVEGLVAKWRETAKAHEGVTHYDYGLVSGLISSADELESAIAADAQSVAAGGGMVVTDDMVGAALRVYRDAEADILGTRATPYNGARLQMMRSAIRAAFATQHGDNT